MALFMQINGVKGNVTAKGYEGCIDLGNMDIQVGKAISLDRGRGGARTSGSVQVSEVALSKLADGSSLSLIQNVLGNKAIPEVTIYLVRSGDSLEAHGKYIFHNVLLSHYHESVDGDTGRPMEHLALNFTSFEKTYIPRDSSNKSGSPMTMGYSLSEASLL